MFYVLHCHSFYGLVAEDHQRRGDSEDEAGCDYCVWAELEFLFAASQTPSVWGAMVADQMLRKAHKRHVPSKRQACYQRGACGLSRHFGSVSAVETAELQRASNPMVMPFIAWES